MKQLKKLNYYNKRIVSAAGLNPKEWGLVSENNESITIMHRETNETKVLRKGS